MSLVSPELSPGRIVGSAQTPSFAMAETQRSIPKGETRSVYCPIPSQARSDEPSPAGSTLPGTAVMPLNSWLAVRPKLSA